MLNLIDYVSYNVIGYAITYEIEWTITGLSLDISYNINDILTSLSPDINDDMIYLLVWVWILIMTLMTYIPDSNLKD